MKADAVRFAVRFALEASSDNGPTNWMVRAAQADLVADDALKLLRLARVHYIAFEAGEGQERLDVPRGAIAGTLTAYDMEPTFNSRGRTIIRLPSGSELEIPSGRRERKGEGR